MFTREDIARGYAYKEEHGYEEGVEPTSDEEWEKLSVEERAEIQADWLIWFIERSG